ncbi:MAG: ABC transporter ATP-binding protein [Candidatus Bathyarchaeia archaeon]
MLEVNGVDTFYGEAQVLHNVKINVRNGELVAIVGSNGAGKSTLLKTIAGLIHPSSGSITFLGEKIDRLPPYKVAEKGIIYTPEGRRIFPQMTVLENLLMGAYTREARRKIKENIERVYQLFPVLKERKNQIAGTLSGGEQQMLTIGRSLMANPKLLLLDEPSLGLAPKIILDLYESIKKIHEQGTTILLVEQNVQISLSICDRAYVLENGRIILEGRGEELLNNDEVRKAYLGI